MFLDPIRALQTQLDCFQVYRQVRTRSSEDVESHACRTRHHPVNEVSTDEHWLVSAVGYPSDVGVAALGDGLFPENLQESGIT